MRCNNCGWNNADDATSCVKCNSPLTARPAVAAGGGIRLDDPGPGPSEQKGSGQPTVAGRQAGIPDIGSPGTERGAAARGAAARGERLAGTARSAAEQGESLAEIVDCPKCKYPSNSQVETCPFCGSPLKGGIPVTNKGTGDPAAEKPPVKGTERWSGGLAGNLPAGEGTVDPFRQQQPKEEPAPPALYLERVGRPDEASQLLTFPVSEDQVSVNRGSLEENNFTITGKTQATFIHKDGKWLLQDTSELKTTFILVNEPYELKDGDVILMGDRRFIFYSTKPGDVSGKA